MPEKEDGGNNTNQQEQQYNGLGPIKVISFTANPAAVTPFDKTTVSWTVVVPNTLHFPVQFVVAGQTFSGSSGSVTTEVVTGAEFALTAKSPLVSRVIAVVHVTSDTSACVSNPTLDAITLQEIVTGQVVAAIPPSDQFSFRGNGPSSKVGLGTISIDIPLNINVRHWFDAQADVSVVLNVGGKGPIAAEKLSVELGSVNVKVNWSLASQIISLGCEHFIKDAMQTLAKAFLTQIITAQVAPQFQDSIQQLIDTTATNAKTADPQHRTFVLTSFLISTDGLSITVCPKPNPPAPPSRLPVEILKQK